MRQVRRLVLLVLAFGMAGCVSTTDFEAYKAKIKASGEATDAWMAAAQVNIVWTQNKVVAKLCTVADPCTPPPLPPAPPDNDWGM